MSTKKHVFIIKLHKYTILNNKNISEDIHPQYKTSELSYSEENIFLKENKKKINDTSK